MASLTGCSSLSGASVTAAKLAWHRHARVAPTAESVAAQPYYQLQVNAPGGQAVLVLGGVAAGRQAWYGKHGQAVFLRDGILVKTLGLPDNLDRTHFPADDPFSTGLQHLRAPLSFSRVLDWSPGYRYGVQARSTLRPMGIEDVPILGTVHHLRRIDEHLRSDDGSLDVVNRYWIDPSDGFIWKSRQFVAPGEPLELIQLRPYRPLAP